MHLKSILIRVEPLKSFVYKEQRFVEVAGDQPAIEVDIEPRANGRPICSGCGKRRPAPRPSVESPGSGASSTPSAMPWPMPQDLDAS